MYRDGSKLAVVYAAFTASGIEAAFAKGLEIGLSPSTLKIQSKRWGGDAPAPKLKTKQTAIYTPAPTTKPRFRLTNGKREFIVIDAGPQQSVVRWLDTRDEQCMPNNWMIPVKT